MADYRQICLYNVLYKLIFKVIINRLKCILPHVISKFQSAFIPGRLTADNIVIGFEILHSLKKNTGKQGFLSPKLDMSKAYGRVEWNYIEQSLNIWCFPP